jgi:hypothetical protein
MMLHSGKEKLKDNKNQMKDFTLKYSKFFIWFGIVMTCVFLSVIAALLLTTNLDDFDTIGLFATMILFSCFAIYLSLACKNWGITFNNESFIYRTTLGKEYKFLFNDVKDYKRGTEIIVLRTDRKRLYIDPKLTNVHIFLNILEKKGDFDKTKLNEIRLTRGNFLIGVMCLVFSVFLSFLFVIPNNSVEGIVTAWWEYIIIILINVAIYIFTFGSLKWRIHLNDQSLTYVTYFGRSSCYNYSEVSIINMKTSLIIIKARDKYYFIDSNAIGIEKFLKRVK